MEIKIKYGIGTKYIAQGKRKDICTIIDIIEHYSYKENKVISVNYIVEYEFFGQIITNNMVTEITLDRAKNDGRILELKEF